MPEEKITNIKTWRRIAEKILLAGAVVFFVRLLAGNWLVVFDHLKDVNWIMFGLAWLMFGLYFIFRAGAWWIITRRLQIRLPFSKASYIWFIAEFGRYIPGNIWSFLGRIYLAQKENVPRKSTLTSMGLEMVFLAGGSLVFVVVFFLFSPQVAPNIPQWPLLAALPLLGLMIYPRWLEKGINKVLKIVKKEPVNFDLDLKQTVGIMLVFIAAWLTYGVGNYLVMASLIKGVQLPVAWLISSFVLAWLIGYLSIVTPMGLGVREGAITLLIGPIISWPLAGLVAVMTRVWLMVSELTFLGGVFVYTQLKNWPKSKKRLFYWWQNNRAEIILGLLILTYVAYFTSLTFLRHANFITSRYDLGNMDQTVWNTLQGNFFQLTRPEGEGMLSRFAIHGDIFLVIMTPFYWVISSPYVLLFIQTVVLALGALPLYWLGKEVIGNKFLALLVCFAYLTFPPMQRANIFDFHAVTLATTFLLFAFYYAYRQRYIPLVIFSILALTTKETMAFTVAMLGIYLVMIKRSWKVGMVIIIVSLGWFYVLIERIIPGVRGPEGAHFALGYYEHLGKTPRQIIGNFVLNPKAWFVYLANGKTALYLLYFLVPTGFIAILSPIILLALPEIALNVVSKNTQMQTIFYQYTSAITPFVFISMIFGIAKVRSWLEKRRGFLAKGGWIRQPSNLIAMYIIFWLAIGLLLWSPLPGFAGRDVKPFYWRHPSGRYLTELSHKISTDEAVSATSNLSPHFTHRQESYLFPNGVGRADYIIVQEGDWYELYPPEKISERIRELEKDTRYERIYQKGMVQVFRKKSL